MAEKIVTIRFAVPLGHMPGDYAVLYSNNGSGAINWDTPVSGERLDLFPGGAGNYGWGMAPWGMSPFGLPAPRDVKGWGETPWGMSPFGCGCIVIERQVRLADCGDYKFALKCFDAAGNAHAGTPNEAAVSVHVAPPRASGLKYKSYDPATDILVLTLAGAAGSGIDGMSGDGGFGGGGSAGSGSGDGLPSRLMSLVGGPFDGFGGRISSPLGDDLTWTDPGLPSRAT